MLPSDYRLNFNRLICQTSFVLLLCIIAGSAQIISDSKNAFDKSVLTTVYSGRSVEQVHSKSGYADNAESWFSADKGYHFLGSMMITIAASKGIMRSGCTDLDSASQTGALISFSVGLGKEIWDSTKEYNRFSYRDLTANVAGIIVGLIILQAD